jgi:IS5 family transposase
MIGKQQRNTDQMQAVSPETLLPPNHLLRRLHAALDLSFVRQQVAPFYSEIGRRSVDPELVARIWILQYFYGFSEREVLEEISMHAGFRWFCGLSFSDPVPDQSTLVKLRTDKWAGSGLWKALLDETVRACEAAGIARGKRMGIDGTQIDANAAIVSLEAIPPTLTLIPGTAPSQAPAGDGEPAPPQGAPAGSSPASRQERDRPPEAVVSLPKPPAEPGGPATQGAGPTTVASEARTLTVEAGGRPQGSHKSGDPDWHGEHFSNATHRSTTDPEARLYRKGKGQEAKLRYLGHYMADLPSGVIYGAMATPATGTAEREAALVMVQEAVRRPRQVPMDLGYRDGEFLAAMEALGVEPLVPLGEEALEKVPTWQRRTFDARQYEQRQRAVAAARARNAARLSARGRQGVVAQRQRTRLEHLIGEGKEHHGLRRAQGRGVERVDQQVKLTAVVQNLKRLLAGLCRRRGGRSAPEPQWEGKTLDLRGRVQERREAEAPRPGSPQGRGKRFGERGREESAGRGVEAGRKRHRLLGRLAARVQQNTRRCDRVNGKNALIRSLTLQHGASKALLARTLRGIFSSRF